jgi:hypothetical protein
MQHPIDVRMPYQLKICIHADSLFSINWRVYWNSVPPWFIHYQSCSIICFEYKKRVLRYLFYQVGVHCSNDAACCTDCFSTAASLYVKNYSMSIDSKAMHNNNETIRRRPSGTHDSTCQSIMHPSRETAMPSSLRQERIRITIMSTASIPPHPSTSSCVSKQIKSKSCVRDAHQRLASPAPPNHSWDSHGSGGPKNPNLRKQPAPSISKNTAQSCIPVLITFIFQNPSESSLHIMKILLCSVVSS